MKIPFTYQEQVDPESQLGDSLRVCINRLIAAHPWLEPNVLARTADRIACENASFKVRWRNLIALADKFSAAVCEQATCRHGCSHCCSLQTLIYRHEAVILSQASGRPYIDLPYRHHDHVIIKMNMSPPKPCPFLAAGKCSVYKDRPMICRLHNSFNDNPSDCDPLVPRLVPPARAMFDPDLIEIAYHKLLVTHSQQEPWGTIHEFFPT